MGDASAQEEHCLQETGASLSASQSTLRAVLMRAGGLQAGCHCAQRSIMISSGMLFCAGCDVLWGGCPMVTLPLERMASRVAASLCYATGLGPEMVVSSQQEYEVSLLPLPLSAWITAPLRYAAAGPEKGRCQGMLEGGHAFNTSC